MLVRSCWHFQQKRATVIFLFLIPYTYHASTYEALHTIRSNLRYIPLFFTTAILACRWRITWKCV